MVWNYQEAEVVLFIIDIYSVHSEPTMCKL